MVYGVVFVMILAVTAIDGQQDAKYDALQSEVSALKKFVNVEFGRLRQEHEEMREELRAVRGRHGSIDTHSSVEGDSLPQVEHNNGQNTVLHTRVAGQALNGTSPTHWNESQASPAKGSQGDSNLHASKGEKGTTGSTGPKGDIGNIGPIGMKGEKGLKGDEGDSCTIEIKGSNGAQGAPGSSGPKGDKGEVGTRGPKGNPGSPGTTGHIGQQGDIGPTGDRGIIGPMGPKGNAGAPGTKGHRGYTGQKGDAGNAGIVGQKGDIGSQGTKGEKGEAGLDRAVPDISFSVGKKLNHHDHLPHVEFDEIYLNSGHDFDRSTGEFTCGVGGMYLFTLSSAVSPGHNIQFQIKLNGHHWRYLAISGYRHHQTASVSGLVRLKHGDTMTVQLVERTDTETVDTTFEGVLLYL